MLFCIGVATLIDYEASLVRFNDLRMRTNKILSISTFIFVVSSSHFSSGKIFAAPFFLWLKLVMIFYDCLCTATRKKGGNVSVKALVWDVE